MTNPSKQRGTRYEGEVADYFRRQGWVQAERRALAGANDMGDITGIPGVVIECKNHRTHDLAGWVAELEVELGNAGCDIGLVAVRRRGTADRSRDYAVMPMHVAVRLLRIAEDWTGE